MRVIVQPSFRKEQFTVEIDYNDTVENLMVKCTLLISEVPINELALSFGGTNLKRAQLLSQVGIQDFSTVQLRQVERDPCCRLL